MASILEGGFAAEVSAALEAERVPYDLTVTRTELEDVNNTPWDPSDDVETETAHACRGWLDAFDQDHIDGTLIRTDDVRILILASSLAITPTTADTVTVDGTTYTIVNIKRDPAGALWELQGRV